MKMVVCKPKCWVDEEKSVKKLWFSHLSIDLTEKKGEFSEKAISWISRCGTSGVWGRALRGASLAGPTPTTHAMKQV